MTAPVCHLPTDPGPTQQPKPVPFQNIPNAYDLPTALAAINALRQMVMHLAGMLPPNSRSGGNGTSKPNQPPKPKLGKFVETNRSTSKVKITNPEDPEQFVEVERINKLVFQDSVTGETWSWTR